MQTKEQIYGKGILNILLWCNVQSGYPIVISPELKVLELNWGYLVMAPASQKSGQSSREFCLQQLNQWNRILTRSLEDRWHYCGLKYENHLITLGRLADRGYFKNNRQMIVNCCWPSIPALCRVIRSMTDLETLSLLEWKPTLIEDVPQLFRSCPKLTEMHLRLLESSNFEMGEEHKNEVRSCFQSLKIFELEWDIVSCPAIQEMLT